MVFNFTKRVRRIVYKIFFTALSIGGIYAFFPPSMTLSAPQQALSVGIIIGIVGSIIHDFGGDIILKEVVKLKNSTGYVAYAIIFVFVVGTYVLLAIALVWGGIELIIAAMSSFGEPAVAEIRSPAVVTGVYTILIVELANRW